MLWVRRCCVVTAALLAGCSTSAIVVPPAPGLDRSTVVAKATAALRRPGRVVEIVDWTPGFPSSTQYVAADGRVASMINGHSEVVPSEWASTLSYLLVLTEMDRFDARVARTASGAMGVVATGRFRLGDSSACRTNETIVLDTSYLPVRWITKSCDSTRISRTFTARVLAADGLPADLFG